MTSTLAEDITNHYVSCWGSRPIVKKWDKGPVWELPPSFCVLEFPPTAMRNLWTYVTCEMSQPLDDEPLELHLFSPVQSDRHVELLTAIAHYHRTEQFLGLGHTVNFGRPWLNESKCEYGLISLPYLDGPRLEEFHTDKSKHMIRFLWLVPITARERDYKKSHGLEALEERLERDSFDYADPHRSSVV